MPLSWNEIRVREANVFEEEEGFVDVNDNVDIISYMDTKRTLEMKFAGRFIDLLGHQMYGGPVPAVVELVANAWDADSEKVEITIPDDPKDPNSAIVVKHYGSGMDFDELNDKYLKLGYEKRKSVGDKTLNGRPVMGRKGIGKLACFGIAKDMILRAVKDKHLVELSL